MRVLYSRFSARTGRRIGEALDVRASSRFVEDDVIINWGNSLRDRPTIPENIIWLNHPKAIANATNKYKATEILERNGVSVPIITDRQDAEPGFGRTIVRPKYHRAGKDVHIYDSFDEVIIPSGYYAAEFIEDIKTEYRIQVFKDVAIRVQRKVPKDENHDDTMRNHTHGWKFILNKEFDTSLLNIIKGSIEAVRVLELDFGAVDAVATGHGFWYILEVNTGFTLDDYGVEIYTKKIKEYLNETI